MHIEHKAAHGHRRVAAIIDQLVPVGVAQFCDVPAEGLEQIERVLAA